MHEIKYQVVFYQLPGNTSPSIFRDKLKDSIKLKDENEIASAIKRCIAAGYPELQSDVDNARKSLNILQGGDGHITSAAKIRDQLRTAINQKNKSLLDNAICEAEEAGYPEISGILCKARDTMESLGYGRGGVKTPDSLRIKLDQAKRQNDKSTLENAIEECIGSGHPELMSDIQLARYALDFMEEDRASGWF
ncbi:uncharacterized protein LOC128248363 [Octopus bimaculoides]|uniref:uncharacterized protein LOC128248363 n=1 Tax=Octopus bimaculoides TaxID=37653 RepID=UPI0022DE9B99|nr:uncharacterized protein LOC128248363 [Octopus bimaculoides]